MKKLCGVEYVLLRGHWQRIFAAGWACREALFFLLLVLIGGGETKGQTQTSWNEPYFDVQLVSGAIDANQEGNTRRVCKNSRILIAATGSAPLYLTPEFAWQGEYEDGTPVQWDGIFSGSQKATYEFTATKKVTFIVTLSTSKGQFATQSIIIDPIEKPIISFREKKWEDASISDIKICQTADDVVLEPFETTWAVESLSGSLYSYQADGRFTYQGTGEKQDGNFTFSVYINDVPGCKAEFSKPLHFYTPPTISLRDASGLEYENGGQALLCQNASDIELLDYNSNDWEVEDGGGSSYTFDGTEGKFRYASGEQATDDPSEQKFFFSVKLREMPECVSKYSSTIKLFAQPQIELGDTRFSQGSEVALCATTDPIELKGYNKWVVDDKRAVQPQQSVFSFDKGFFSYEGSGGSDVGVEENFKFSLSVHGLPTCVSDYASTVKVYKPKELEIDLGGKFCAGSKPIKESFDKAPTSGTYKISLWHGGATLKWTKDLADAKETQLDDAGKYTLKTSYSFLLPNTNQACASSEVSKEFEVVAVPGKPEWNSNIANPLSICAQTSVPIVEMTSPVEDVTYRYTLSPDGIDKDWRQGEFPVAFQIGKGGSYTVGLQLVGVKACSNDWVSSPLEVKMQEKLSATGVISFSEALCEDSRQSLITGDKEIGYSNIEDAAGGVPGGYEYRWVRAADQQGSIISDVFQALKLTFNALGSGTGQQGQIKPVAGENKYVLQYRMVGAGEKCWSQVGNDFTVRLTSSIQENVIKSSGAGVCNGVEVEITGDKPKGGDGQYIAIWMKDGQAVSSTGSVTSYEGQVDVGRYRREITSGGCRVGSNEVLVQKLENPFFTVVKVNPRCEAASDGEITVTATAPLGENVAFSYDGGKTFESFAKVGIPMKKGDLGIGKDFVVVAKTDKGCLSLHKEEVNFAVQPFTVQVDVPSAACWGSAVDATVSWTGGAPRPGDSYFVTVTKDGRSVSGPDNVGGVTQTVRKDLTKGTYLAKVVYPSASGMCYGEESFEVKEPAPVNPRLFNVVCPGGSDGMIRATIANATNVNYVLEKDSANVWPVVQGNYDGVFVGLEAGKYRVRVSMPGCAAPPVEVEISQDPFTLTLHPSANRVTCPGDVIEYIEGKINTSGTQGSYDYIWARDVAGAVSYRSTHGSKLLDALVGKYVLTVIREDGCAMSSDTLEVDGPLPFAWTKPPVVTPAPCKDYEGDRESKGTVVFDGVVGGVGAQAWWLTSSNREDVGQRLEFGRVYALRSDTWKVRVEDQNGCRGELSFDVGYIPDNSVSFTLARNKQGEKLCFGEHVSGVSIVEDAGTRAKIDWSAPQVVTLEREFEGKILVDTLQKGVGGFYSSTRGVEGASKLRAVVQAQGSGCRSVVVDEILTHSPFNLRFDRHVSDVDVFFLQPVIDAARSWKDASGKVVYSVMKDSIVAGVLSDIPRKVGVSVDYGVASARLEYTALPPEVFTPVDGEQRVFTMSLPQNAMMHYRDAGRVVSAQFGRKPIDVLHTTIRVSDPKTECYEDLNLYVRMIRELSIPNVFTPNGDGINDRWLSNSDPMYQTVFSNLTSLLPNIEVEVFNRAGARVWNAKAEKVAEGWDGTAKGAGGAALPVGTYYYVIRFNIEGDNSWKPIAGSVTIVR